MAVNRFVRFSTAIVVATALTACSSDKAEISSVANQFKGTWQSDCIASDPADVDTTFDTTRISISGNQMVVLSSAFLDSACETPAGTANMEATYSVSYTGETTDSGLGIATNVDYILDSIKSNDVELTDEERRQLNIAEQAFDILFVSGNRLYEGITTSTRDGSSSATRPDALDQSTVYRRKLI